MTRLKSRHVLEIPYGQIFSRTNRDEFCFTLEQTLELNLAFQFVYIYIYIYLLDHLLSFDFENVCVIIEVNFLVVSLFVGVLTTFPSRTTEKYFMAYLSS